MTGVKTPELSLYDGAVLLQFSPAGHRYKVSLDGGTTWEKKTGVTTVLAATIAKDGLLPWAARLAAETFLDLVQAHHADGGSWADFDSMGALDIAKKAHVARKDAGADIGSIVHQHIEDYIAKRHTKIPDEPEARRAIAGFMTWVETIKPKWLASERPVYSVALDYCGTFDALAEINGETVLIDFKTGNARANYKNGRFVSIDAYPEHYVQLGGYSLAYTEETGLVINRTAVLYIQKDGSPHYFATKAPGEVLANEHAFGNALELYQRLKELNT